MRELDTKTLDQAALDYAALFQRPSSFSWRSPKVATNGRDWVLQSLYNAAFKDEFQYLLPRIMDSLGGRHLVDFEAEAKKIFTPRNDNVFNKELADRLAITPNGDHVDGKIGRVVVGQRFMGMQIVEVEAPSSIRERKEMLKAGVPWHGHRRTTWKEVPVYWPIYAGEEIERDRNSGVADEFVTKFLPLARMVVAPGISNEVALLACDAVVDQLDEGTGAAVIRIYEASRATDVDTAVGAQTLGGTLVCSDPAFGNAADAAPGGTATASAITDDSSADATITAAWFRASATNDGATPLDDHIDGNVGTATTDMVLNTTSIVTGAVISISSWTVTMPES